MIKAVTQTLPTYTMSTFDIPTKICEILDAQIRKFWWNPKNPNGRYLAWKAWDGMCLSRRDGRLEFKKAKMFDKALVAKLAWMTEG